MLKMKQKDAAAAAALLEALDVAPKLKRALTEQGRKGYDGVWLEISATEMAGGEGQGGSYYFYLPPAAGRAVLDAATNAIRKELAKLGVEIG